MNLLLRDYRTPIKTPIKRLQHSYQEITGLLRISYKSLIKRLQHSYQEITALLSRDHKTPINLL